MITEEMVLTALKDCFDPEIPVNIVDLGLIYAVRVNDSRVEVDMTLTAPGCPMSAPISEDAKAKVLAIAGVKEATVNIVWDPPWTPERMSEQARKALGFG